MQRVTSKDFEGVSVAEPSKPTKHAAQGKWFQDYKKKMASADDGFPHV
jgi:hypothetical protein